MPTFDRCTVSTPWHAVLSAARADGVRFRLNSGRRTMAQQRRLYAAWLRYRRVLAAVPNPRAPHIREGRDDHALDVDMHVGHGIAGLRRWLARQGLRTALTVPGEGWHLEALSERALRACAARLSRPALPWLTRVERRRTLELDRLVRARRDRPRRVALRRALRRHADAIERAARRPRALGGGWDRRDRRRRHRTLTARL